MSENLKKYRLGIIDILSSSRHVQEIITYVVGGAGVLINFVPAKIPKYITIIVYILFCGLLLYINKHISNNIEKISADNKYLDQEILLLKEYANDLEQMKRRLSLNLKQSMQIAQFTAALEYAIFHLNKIINSNSNNYNEFKKNLDNLIFDIYKTLKIGYIDYSEKMTVALYLYCNMTDEYLDYISCKPDIAKTRKGRIWKATDDAHICYVGRHADVKEFIFNDINSELPKPKNYQQGDSEEYKSSISIPIFNIDNTQLRAVLSVTSNYIARFDKTNVNESFNNQLNTIFINLFYSIAKIIEIILNNKYPDNEQQILKDILEDYNDKRPECLTDIHKKILNDFQAKQI